MYYNADNQPFIEPLRLNGKQIFNPSAAQLEAAGYHEVQPTATAISADEQAKSDALMRIEQLTEQLRATDYKVVKVAEAAAVGAECPYSEAELTALHTEREAAREEINNLQATYGL